MAGQLDEKLVLVHRPGQVRVVELNEVLSGEDVVPGFECKVADFMG